MRQYDRAARLRSRRPFWLPASNYYFLAVSAALGFFFLAWGILHDAGEETPWITAGIGASLLLFGAVLLRELVLRRFRNRFIRRENLLDKQIKQVYSRIEPIRAADKLTIERNAVLIGEIKRKSEAAKVLGKLAAAHREVFELCDSYLEKNESELRTIGAGSPRLGPLIKGKESAGRHHHYHMLRWAELETSELSQAARDRPKLDEKLEAANKAIGVIEFALGYYPYDRSLIESREVLGEMAVSIEVTGIVEEAEQAAFQGNVKQARSLYRDALFRLGRDDQNFGNREAAAERINRELEKLQIMDSEPHKEAARPRKKI